ncbi:MAG TPA: DUF1330 domain-containing protein [Motiliproteus sp.]
MPKAYCVASIVRIRDAEAFARYVAGHPPTLAPYGGRFLVKGYSPQPLEGRWEGSRLVIHEFPSLDQLRAWYESAEYRPWRTLRQQAAEVNVVIAEGGEERTD